MPSHPSFWLRQVLSAAQPIAYLVVGVYLLTRTIAFDSLFGVLGPHSGTAITQREIPDAALSNSNARIPSVPKILHQIFHNWHDTSDDTILPLGMRRGDRILT
jgi:inositol phosphorylceramide mannosyltransferase catalytic subunit